MIDNIQTETPVGDTPKVVSPEPSTAPATGEAVNKSDISVPVATRPQTEPAKDPDADFNAIVEKRYGKKETPKPEPVQPSKGKTPEAGDAPASDVKPDDDEYDGKPPSQVPYEKLKRALGDRRESITRAEAAEKALKHERSIVDHIATRYTRAGIPEDKILPLADAILAARQGNAEARRFVLEQIGVEMPKPSQSGITVEAVEELVRSVQNAIDPDVVLSQFKSKHAPAAQSAVPPQQPQQQQSAPAYDNNAVLDYAGTLLDGIEQAEGKEFVDSVLPKIQASIQARAAEHARIHGQITTEAAKRLYRQIQADVVAAEKKRLAKPPVQLASAPPSNPPISIDPNDPDRDFKTLMSRKYGSVI
jgi:hypothetical protein